LTLLSPRRSSKSGKIASTEAAPLNLPAWPYLDASAAVKLYLTEPGSEELQRATRGRDDLLLSELAATEVTSALARGRRERKIPVETAVRIHRKLREHLAGGVFQRVELDSATHEHAERLLLSASLPLRAGDALHIALAMAAHSGVIVTFDIRLARAARQTGLATVPALPGLDS
jgi:predicted nucleic acid-binding protein